MRFNSVIVVLALVVAACTSRDVGPYAPTEAEKQTELKATQNIMCAFENQARCAHLIENRLLLSRFYLYETLGGLNESEKYRGRSVTNKFVAEAAANIRQCRRVSGDTVSIIKGLELAGSTYEVRGSSPLSEEDSACFLAPFQEAS